MNTHTGDAMNHDAQAWHQQALMRVQHGNVEAAFELHQRAADAGHVGSLIEAARMQLHGIGTARDAASAVYKLEAAEAAGMVMASHLLADIAIGGIALPRDSRIDQRIMAAVQAGYPPAMLAAAIHFGRKPHPEDQALCMQLLKDAAARGDVLAATLLAERLLDAPQSEQDVRDANDLHTALAAHGVPRLPRIACAAPQSAACAPRTLELLDALSAPRIETMHAQPFIGSIDGLLSVDECRLLIASAQPLLHPSQTVDPLTGAAMAHEIRTSSDVSFDPLLENVALRLVQLRMSAAAGIDLVHAEQLIVLHYAPGQEYRPHRDYLPPAALQADHPEAGNRARTICVFLNRPDAGGATAFPEAGVDVAPVTGRAVVFDNLHADGSPDPDSLHAGTPVIAGEKWLATLWLRQGRYRDH